MAALTVGELAVELEARTKEFNSRFSAVEKRIDRFEHQTGRATKAAGLSFRKLVGPIAAVGAAIGAIQVTRGILGIQKSAIQSAAAFEGYEVQLRTLLGSQQAANRSLDSFLTLSSRTPFGLAQIVSGATTLATAAQGSRQELESLVETTANLAALTQLPFQEAAGNLQRALSAGIGAADLFRDKGVRKMIEDVNGIPDLTKVSLEELRVLFKKTFAPGAVSGFGTAARDLATTLQGSLSNIGDATERLRISLGKTLSPAVVATATGVIIPFFDELTGKIQDNEEALQRFFIEGFAKGAEVVAEVVEYLGPLAEGFSEALDRVDELQAGARKAFQAVMIFIKALSTGFQLLGTGLNTVGTGLQVVSHLLGLRTAEEVEEQFLRTYNSAEASREAVDDLAAAMDNFGKEAPEDAAKAGGAFDELAEKIRAGGDAIRKIGEEQIQLAKARAAANDEVAVAAGRAATRTEQEIADIKAEFEDLDRELFEKVASGEWKIDLSAGLGDEETTKKVQGVLGQAFEGVLDDLSVSDGLQTFADNLAGVSSETFRTSMLDVLSDIGDGFEEMFSDLLSSLSSAFQQSGLGQFLGGGNFNLGAGIGALAGLGGKLLTGALQGTESRVSNDLVRSAVTSTQAVRGVVAGPTAIPIAQVGNAIRDAMAGQLTELRRGNTLLASILDAIRGLDVGSYSSGEDLAAAIAAEFNGSVALG